MYTENNTHYSSFHERDTERFKDAKDYHDDQLGERGSDAVSKNVLLDKLVNQTK